MTVYYKKRTTVDANGWTTTYLSNRRVIEAPDAREVPQPPTEWIVEKVACPHCGDMFINVKEHITKIHGQTGGYIIDVTNDSETDKAKCIVYEDGKKICEVPASCCGICGDDYEMYEFLNDDMDKLFPQKKRSYKPETWGFQTNVFVAHIYLPIKKKTGKGELIKMVIHDDGGGYNADVKTYKGKRITVIDSLVENKK